MLTALLSYQFGVNPLRIVRREGEPWFAATDVAQALGYRDAANLVRNLEDDEKGTHNVSTLGGDQELTIISESGLYAAIFRSRKPEARLFRKWVTSEVLPAIRKTGTFTLAGADPVKSLTAAMKAVTEARRLYGAAGAREVWAGLGLPSPGTSPEDDLARDPLTPEVRAFVANRAEATIPGVLAGLGYAEATMETRRKIGAILRHLGWAGTPARRDGVVVKVFTPIDDS